MEKAALIVNIILAVLSFALAVISIVTVIITLKQNSKMLEANSRPYVNTYFAFDESYENGYICIKNFGNSAAKIKKINISPDVTFSSKYWSFGEANMIIAPGQQFHFDVDTSMLKKRLLTKSSLITMCVEYEDITTNKQYKEVNETDISYIVKVPNAEHKILSKSDAENALINIERDLRSMKNNML